MNVPVSGCFMWLDRGILLILLLLFLFLHHRRIFLGPLTPPANCTTSGVWTTGRTTYGEDGGLCETPLAPLTPTCRSKPWRTTVSSDAAIGCPSAGDEATELTGTLLKNRHGGGGGAEVQEEFPQPVRGHPEPRGGAHVGGRR